MITKSFYEAKKKIFNTNLLFSFMVCPKWTKTFFKKALIEVHNHTKYEYLSASSPSQINKQGYFPSVHQSGFKGAWWARQNSLDFLHLTLLMTRF